MSDSGSSDPVRLEVRCRILEALVGHELPANDAIRAELKSRFPDHEALVDEVLEDSSCAGSDSGSLLPLGLGLFDGRQIGRFRVEREIGRGGQGRVFLATDEKLGRRVALKVLNAVLSESALRRFQREAEVTSQLDHPGICTIYDVGTHHGIPYIAMGYVEGAPLSKLVANRDSTWTWRTGVELVRQAALAVHVAHEASVVHRDIKPDNLMVTPDGRCVVMDFGLAGPMSSSEAGGSSDPKLTRSGDVFGTPDYMSPEQILGEHSVDHRIDVWALGATLYECVTGRRPFVAPNREALFQRIVSSEPQAIRGDRDLPRDLVAVLDHTLAKEPDQRYESAALLAADLESVLRGEPVAVRPVSQWTKASRWARRNPLLAGLGMTTVLGIISLAVVATLFVMTRAQQQQDLRHDLELALQEHGAARAQAMSLANLDPNASAVSWAAAVEAAERAQDVALRLRSRARVLSETTALLATARKEEAEGRLHAARVEKCARFRLRALELYATSVVVTDDPEVPARVMLAEALADFGIDLDDATTDSIIESLPPEIHGAASFAIGRLRDFSTTDRQTFERFQDLIQALDPHPGWSQIASPPEAGSDRSELRREIVEFSRGLDARSTRPALVRDVVRVLHDLEADDAGRQLVVRMMDAQPTSVFLLLIAAEQAFSVGNAKQEEVYSRVAVAITPDTYAARLLLARVVDRTGDRKRAEHLMADLAEDYSDSPWVHNALAGVLWDQRRYEDLLPYARKAAQLMPDRARFRAQLAGALQNLGRVEEALVEAETAVELEPETAFMYYRLGSVYAAMSRWKESEAANRQYLDRFSPPAVLDPYRERYDNEHASVLNNLGNALFMQGKGPEALTYFEQAVELRPDYPLYCSNVTFEYMQQGRFEEAAEAAYQCLDHYDRDTRTWLSEDYLQLHVNAANAMRGCGWNDEMIPMWRESLFLCRRLGRREPELWDLHLELGQALLREGKVSAGLESVQTAVDLLGGGGEQVGAIRTALGSIAESRPEEERTLIVEFMKSFGES